MQSSFCSYQIEMSDMVARLFIMLPCCDFWDRAGDKVTVQVCGVVMSVLFVADNVGTELVLVMLEQS